MKNKKNNTMWVVTNTYLESGAGGWNVEGVFSTRKLAQDYAEQRYAEERKKGCFRRWNDENLAMYSTTESDGGYKYFCGLTHDDGYFEFRVKPMELNEIGKDVITSLTDSTQMSNARTTVSIRE